MDSCSLFSILSHCVYRATYSQQRPSVLPHCRSTLVWTRPQTMVQRWTISLDTYLAHEWVTANNCLCMVLLNLLLWVKYLLGLYPIVNYQNIFIWVNELLACTNNVFLNFTAFILKFNHFSTELSKFYIHSFSFVLKATL